MMEKNSIDAALTETFDARCMIQICEDVESWFNDFQENISEEEAKNIDRTIDVINNFLWNNNCSIEEFIKCGSDILEFLRFMQKNIQDEEV